MSKLLSTLLVALCCSAVAFAQPAEKAAAASSAVTQFVFSAATSGVTPFVTVLSTSIKPPAADNDLFIRFSAQTLLVTNSVNNDTIIPAVATTFTAENVAIQVRALLDGVPLPVAPPSLLTIVTLDNLIRSTFRFTPGQIDFLTLVIDEGGTRAFNWIATNVSTPGVHTVAIQARFVFSNARFPVSNTFSSIAAILGVKTLTVDAVNIKTD
jgi:hypothetical protein